MQYTISIVVPAYNAEKHIELMILSVLQQPMKVELIIVNDGSEDKTGEICQKYVALYENIVYIESENKGAGSARNLGVKNATGEYIIFLDSDDVLFKEALDDKLNDFLKVCSSEKKDIIYTTKSKTNIDMSVQPIVTYPEKIIDIKCNMPKLEFWTCIYNTRYLITHNIKFSEYKEQDIETAFRYRAFSRTNQIVVAPEISFYLQRDNLESNTHTFNYYNLYSIKAMVYSELLEEQGSLSEDLAYLQLVVIDNIFKFYKFIWKNSWEGKEIEDKIDILSCKFKKISYFNFSKVFKINCKVAFKYFLKIVILKIIVFNLKLYKKISFKKKKIIDNKVNVIGTRKDLTNDQLLERLNKWSRLRKNGMYC